MSYEISDTSDHELGIAFRTRSKTAKRRLRDDLGQVSKKRAFNVTSDTKKNIQSDVKTKESPGKRDKSVRIRLDKSPRTLRNSLTSPQSATEPAAIHIAAEKKDQETAVEVDSIRDISKDGGSFESDTDDSDPASSMAEKIEAMLAIIREQPRNGSEPKNEDEADKKSS
ncbi:hypothetical protein PWT90_01922 [Aphanocladium album]|nr:hypothetical protein PWT90_01922 [Aphanocladium album]